MPNNNGIGQSEILYSENLSLCLSNYSKSHLLSDPQKLAFCFAMIAQ